MPGANVRAAAAAVTFLTRVPVGGTLELDAADVARGAALFPVVGAGIGVLAGLTAAGLEGPLPPLLAGAVAVAVALLLTGALHLDALADTADALGVRGRDRALEVMRDSRIGSFGAAAVAIAVLVEAEAVGTLAARGEAVAAFVSAAALARAAPLAAAWALPYARGEGVGTGNVLSGRVSAGAVLAGCALALVPAVVLLGRDGLIAAGAVALVAVVLGLFFRAWLGGVTGDTLGATTQLGEVVALVVLVGLR
jgi:adenosylcobinamide-GDP ribazoletransferase